MSRDSGRAGPISVSVTREQRDEFEAEARRRGLGVSTTIRTLAIERARELSYQRQLERARRWQLQRIREFADRVEAGDMAEATQADIDAIFDEADEHHESAAAGKS